MYHSHHAIYHSYCDISQLSHDVPQLLRNVSQLSQDESNLLRDVTHFLHNVVITNFETNGLPYVACATTHSLNTRILNQYCVGRNINNEGLTFQHLVYEHILEGQCWRKNEPRSFACVFSGFSFLNLDCNTRDRHSCGSTTLPTGGMQEVKDSCTL